MHGKVCVREVDPDAVDQVVIDGLSVPTAQTLRTWLDRFGAYEGAPTDPDGEMHHSSLADWSDSDPDSTWLVAWFDHED